MRGVMCNVDGFRGAEIVDFDGTTSTLVADLGFRVVCAANGPCFF